MILKLVLFALDLELETQFHFATTCISHRPPPEISKATEATGARVANFHVSPVMATSRSLPGHEWLIEFEREPESMEAFSRIIDLHLQEVNRHYVIRREADAFDPPRISVLKEGTFFEWLKRTKKKVSAQTKVPRMSEERKISDALLSISRSFS